MLSTPQLFDLSPPSMVLSSSPRPSTRLLADISDPATPLLRSADAYTEKELDDALADLPPPASWSRLTSWRPSRTWLSRRSIALALLCGAGVLTISAGMRGTGKTGEESYAGRVRETTGRWTETVNRLRTKVWEMANGPGKVEWVGFDISQVRVLRDVRGWQAADGVRFTQVINFDEPQETMKLQLKTGVRYATSAAYGGHGALLSQPFLKRLVPDSRRSEPNHQHL